ncbi:hypothetical protein [Paenibacillus sp. sptzw28]|uniref:exo-rhamnogalacturonan lyase family protein n=1 Tax=Paenibacillus sp. sptzw28 TaxID=715179 RepID=UPI0021615D8C|nr:hypothetical protein [Paenibacillus sp. sptzw28]
MTDFPVISLRGLTLDKPLAGGITWGVPWEEGVLQRSDSLTMISGSGAAVPLQSWPAAYWPDGSVKWSAHAAVCPEAGASDYRLSKGDPAQSAAPVSVVETAYQIVVDTGRIVCTLNKQGADLIAAITCGGTEICSGGRLVAVKEEQFITSGGRTLKETSFRSRIHSVKVEQSGPVRSVIKFDGRHAASEGSGAEWLPFSLRLYFYAGEGRIKAVHTLFYDGNPHEDFIKGVGIAFTVPMRGSLYNRHVRFAGDDGFFTESPKSLQTRRTKGRYSDLHTRQADGGKVAFNRDEDSSFLSLLEESAVWDDFKLVQESSGQFRVSKRTKQECCWLKAASGRRAGGLGYVGGEGGGLAAGLRNFWQKHPASINITGAAQNQADLTVWFWSPDCQAMDMRHYDTLTHVESAYEGAVEMRATPYGVANTSEISIWCEPRTPDLDALNEMVRRTQEPALLVCEPEHYYKTRAFGYWSLPERNTPVKAYLEDRLEGIIAFYQSEVEQRDWYGFWDYGDFMHSYDPVRHVWNYDLGGCAWQNTELAPNMWLWYMFLRSGRADIFRLAEAMTRHTSEVDVYHFGEYAGLGSRHNVVHWGCGCKEARIGMAGLHRYYYYLTADERIGDIMDEVKDSDFTTVNIDPMRAYFPKDEHPTHIRVGPDWAAFSSNWMTRWERFEDKVYRDKILVGLDCIKRARFRLLSGPTYGYDPTSGKLSPMGDDNWGRHLAICMGGPQVWFELAMMLRDPEWEDMLAEFGVFYNLPREEKEKATGGAISHDSFHHPVLSTGIAAFGAYYKNDKRTAELVWSILLENAYARINLQEEAADRRYMAPLKEIPWINTNEAAQWSLNTIISLELIGGFIPERLEQDDLAAIPAAAERQG